MKKYGEDGLIVGQAAASTNVAETLTSHGFQLFYFG